MNIGTELSTLSMEHSIPDRRIDAANKQRTQHDQLHFVPDYHCRSREQRFDIVRLGSTENEVEVSVRGKRQTLPEGCSPFLVWRGLFYVSGCTFCHNESLLFERMHYKQKLISICIHINILVYHGSTKTKNFLIPSIFIKFYRNLTRRHNQFRETALR